MEKITIIIRKPSSIEIESKKSFGPDESLPQNKLYLPQKGDYLILNQDKEIGYPTVSLYLLIISVEHHWEGISPEVIIYTRRI